MSHMRSPIKWAGGKHWLVPKMQVLWDLWQPHALYEPFCGSAAVSFGLQPARVRLADANVHLINFLTQWRDGLTITMPEDRDDYYERRARFNELVMADVWYTRESAELFYYLNRAGFNGLCRFNRKGEFNVPVGRGGGLPNLPAFRNVVLTGEWHLDGGSYQDLDLGKSPGLIFADPPYDGDTFTAYTMDDFGTDDQRQLAAWLAEQRHHYVVTTNLATDRMIDLYRSHGFHCYTHEAPRRIAASGNRRNALELFAVNRPLSDAIQSTLELMRP